MDKAFENILERLDELIEKSYYAATEGNHNAGIRNSAYHRVKKIVQEVAEEYNITNGDKIRSMNDEELAEWFETVTDDVMSGSYWNKEGWIKWLQSKAE